MKTAPIGASNLIRIMVLGWLAGQAVAPAQRTPATTMESASAASLSSAVRPGTSSDDEINNASAAAKEKPGDATWTRLGDAYMQKGRETADVSYYGRAEGAYRKALASNPRSANALVGMGWVNGGRHEFEQSIDWAKKALAIDPNRADAYGLLGDAAVEMGDYEKAFDHYQKMLDLRPDISSYSRGAHVLFLTGDIRKATLLMTKAIGSGAPFAENTAWCRAQWALMQFAQGSYLSASQLLTEALRAAPGNYHLLAAMGKVKAAMKDYDAAIDYYKRAEAVVPQHEVVVALGDLYTLQGKTQEAAAQYALVDVIHKLYRANGVIGDIQVAQFFADHDRNLQEAVRLAEAEYSTRPNVYVADTLAWCYYKTGRIAEAQKMIAKALSQNTPEAIFLYHKGAIYAKAGDYAHAKTALYQALSISPDFHPLAAPVAEKMIRDLGSVVQ
jgi:tetratricopeptide (TPR) repeat protein